MIKKNKSKNKTRGFTLVETQVAVLIFSLIITAFASFVVYIYKTHRHSLGQLEASNSARRALELMNAEIRNTQQAETGSYAIDSVAAQSFIFYSDIDEDGQTEKVRYFLDSQDLKKGVTEPNYTGAETITVIVSNIVNNIDPVFEYYDENFTGTEASLALPADVNEVKLVKIILVIDENQNLEPPPLTIETNVQPRNLKEN